MTKTGGKERGKDSIIALALWGEWVDSLKKRKGGTEPPEEFMALHGVKSKTAPIVLMYKAFVGGLGKGIELVERAEAIAQEKTRATIT